MPSSGPIDIKDRLLVSALEPLEPLDNSQVAFHRRSVAGSLIGGIAETQEVLDFCAEHGIVADVEIIPIQKINKILCRSEYIQAQAF